MVEAELVEQVDSIEDEIAELDAEDLRERVRSSWRGIRRLGWETAFAVHRIGQEGLYSAWGYKSLSDWAHADLGISPPTTSKFKGVVTDYHDLDDDLKPRVLGCDVWDFYEVRPLVKKGKSEQAIELIEAGKTNAQVRAAVREETAVDDHHETEWRQINLKVSRETYEKIYLPAERVVRWQACSASVTEEVVMLALCRALLQEPLHIEAKGDGERALVEEMIQQGYWRCQDPRGCGSWDRTGLQRHHMHPKSQEKREGEPVMTGVALYENKGRTYAVIESNHGELLLLCHNCHTYWQPRWRELRKTIGLTD